MRKSFLFVMLILFLSAIPAYSHPHLFIKPEVEFISSKTAITGIRVRWVWDEWWSEDVKTDCDLDKNNVFNAKETALVKKLFFDGVEDFDYFLKITIDDKKIKIGQAKNFSVRVLPNGNVVYEFIVDFPKGQSAKNKLEICFVDKTIYTAFEDKVVLLKNENVIRKKKSEPYGDYGVKLTVWL